jgi:hypothetical protein
MRAVLLWRRLVWPCPPRHGSVAKWLGRHPAAWP